MVQPAVLTFRQNVTSGGSILLGTKGYGVKKMPQVVQSIDSAFVDSTVISVICDNGDTD